MHKTSRRRSDVASLFGFAAFVVALWLLVCKDGYQSFAWPLAALGLLSMFVGFFYYIRAKGYYPAWAFLIFLVGPPAFLVFFILPDRAKQAAEGG
jgi:hypothetical protein